MDIEYLKKTALRVLGAFLSALIIVYLVFHLFSNVGSGIETTLVGETVGERTVSIDGYIFRSESVITSQYTGTRSYLFDDGEKVASGNELATVYSNNTNDSIVEAIERLEEKIALLEAASEAVRLASNDTSQVEGEIIDLLISIKQHVLSGDLSYAVSSEGALLLALSEKQLQLSDTDDFSAAISVLRNQVALLSSKLSGSSVTLKADRDGYFYSKCDGGEGIFTSSAIEMLTPSGLDDMIARAASMEAPAGTVGKLVTDFTWYVAANLDIDELVSFDIGKVYTLIFPSSADTRLEAKLERAVTEPNSDEALLVFSLNSAPQDFDFTRCQSVRVVTSSVRGYAVPMSALRYEDGHTFVYILRGGVVLRRSVDVLDRFNGYFYVSASSEDITDGDTTYYALKKNEYVITHGRNLYHNKIVS